MTTKKQEILRIFRVGEKLSDLLVQKPSIRKNQISFPTRKFSHISLPPISQHISTSKREHTSKLKKIILI